MRPIIPLSLVVVVTIIVGIMGISNYDVYVAERDQRNLQLAVDDFKKPFPQGMDQEESITKSLDVFETEYQKEQWRQRDIYSINP